MNRARRWRGSFHPLLSRVLDAPFRGDYARHMRVDVGTSGYSYKEWKGTFYPPDLPARAMLDYYGRRFTTVEINATFYRMPAERTLLAWAADVPESFLFGLKAPQRITHMKRLKDAGEDFQFFARTATVLGERLGPTLVQLPPNFRKDLDRLAAFTAETPRTWRTAIEFRHPTWFSDDVFDLLKSHGMALCIADTGDLECPRVATAGWGYLRLRRVEYRDEDLEMWAAFVRSQEWTQAFVYFKHEDAATGPRL